ncbi:hypothetical protein K456DRAFT_445549 [Colletotrichum gloeosporioides 23]|nr:hypothetical protein K456DRAFT_445549 [Colletotrichum gloeosporioides 23]
MRSDGARRLRLIVTTTTRSQYSHHRKLVHRRTCPLLGLCLFTVLLPTRKLTIHILCHANVNLWAVGGDALLAFP